MLRAGAPARGALFGDAFTRRVLDEYATWDEEFSDLFQRFVYGGMYDRNVVDQKTRELCAVAACVCLNAMQQLVPHARAAIKMGATPKEVMEVVLQMAVYAGMPYTLQAARAVKKALDEMEQGVTLDRPPGT